MASFKDSQGRQWSINLTIGLASRLKKQFDVDFVGALYDAELAYMVIGKMYQDLGRFCEMIHVAAKVDLPLDEFMESLTGEDVANAFEALDQSFTDFYPPAKREQIAKSKVKMKESLENEQAAIMDEINHKLQTEIKRAVRKAAGLSSSPGK